MASNNYAFQSVSVPGAQGNVAIAGINDFGELSGSYEVGGGGDPYSQAFTETNGSIVTYGAGGAPYGQHSTGAGIDNFGRVVGSSGHYQDTARGYLYSDGSFTRIAGAGDAYFTSAYGVNDHGQVVGNLLAAYTSGTPEAFVWQNGSVTQTFSYPGASSTTATGINDAGRIVGYYALPGSNDGLHFHGFLDVAGHFTPIDVPGAQSTQVGAINNRGEIVGTYFDGQHYHGFIDQGGRMNFINAPGATDTWVNAVNDFGQIAGAYKTSDTGVTEGFVATPGTGHNLSADYALMLPRQVAQFVKSHSGHAYFDPTLNPVVVAVAHT